MSSAIDRLREALAFRQTAGESTQSLATNPGPLVALGLLAVAEAIHEHTTAIEGIGLALDVANGHLERVAETGEGIEGIAKAIRDLDREVAYLSTRIARGA